MMERTRVQVVAIAVGGVRQTAVAPGSDVLEPGWAAVGPRRGAPSGYGRPGQPFIPAAASPGRP